LVAELLRQELNLIRCKFYGCHCFLFVLFEICLCPAGQKLP
jgi:hypothetical protein